MKQCLVFASIVVGYGLYISWFLAGSFWTGAMIFGTHLLCVGILLVFWEECFGRVFSDD